MNHVTPQNLHRMVASHLGGNIMAGLVVRGERTAPGYNRRVRRTAGNSRCPSNGIRHLLTIGCIVNFTALDRVGHVTAFNRKIAGIRASRSTSKRARANAPIIRMNVCTSDFSICTASNRLFCSL